MTSEQVKELITKTAQILCNGMNLPDGCSGIICSTGNYCKEVTSLAKQILNHPDLYIKILWTSKTEKHLVNAEYIPLAPIIKRMENEKDVK